jgi:hypothetical protein
MRQEVYTQAQTDRASPAISTHFNPFPFSDLSAARTCAAPISRFVSRQPKWAFAFSERRGDLGCALTSFSAVQIWRNRHGEWQELLVTASPPLGTIMTIRLPGCGSRKSAVEMAYVSSRSVDERWSSVKAEGKEVDPSQDPEIKG